MNNFSIKKLIANIEDRILAERLVILAVVLIIMAYGWLVFVSDNLGESKTQLERQARGLDGRIAEEVNRYADIERNSVADPNASLRNVQQELQLETIRVDEELNQLYGQLIQPRQMAELLTTILQRDTTLRLVSLQNSNPSLLGSAASDAAVPLVGSANVEVNEGADEDNGLQVYRHGLSMTFEGDYLETIRYLRSLESLDTSFFWSALDYEVTNWPIARITLNVFTLSTQEDWIGV